ncbi:MAG TPA: sigma-70 family RNA polymerase sigma factor [Pirellulales bacterium]|nr:sigma-70 family RNA polymerase sigma factor [Pirellulales bacterium]
MESTPVSLLERMRKPGDADAWNRFVELATPLLSSWAHRLGLQNQDAADLVQEVLSVLVEKLPGFTYDPNKSFRGWMRTIATNKWREWRRRPAPALLETGGSQLAEWPADDGDAFWEQEYRDYLVARALALMRGEFQPNTWQACWQHVVSGRSAADIADDLGMSIGAVYMAKSRVLNRLREELRGLVE